MSDYYCTCCVEGCEQPALIISYCSTDGRTNLEKGRPFCLEHRPIPGDLRKTLDQFQRQLLEADRLHQKAKAAGIPF